MGLFKAIGRFLKPKRGAVRSKRDPREIEAQKLRDIRSRAAARRNSDLTNRLNAGAGSGRRYGRRSNQRRSEAEHRREMRLAQYLLKRAKRLTWRLPEPRKGHPSDPPKVNPAYDMSDKWQVFKLPRFRGQEAGYAGAMTITELAPMHDPCPTRVRFLFCTTPARPTKKLKYGITSY